MLTCRLAHLVIVVAVSVMPIAAHAIWVCHGPQGITWQQDYPPCVMPPEVAEQLKSKAKRKTSDNAATPVPQAAPARPAAKDNPYLSRLTELERKYPLIDPDSTHFDSQVESRVVSTMNQLKARGRDPVGALEEAVYQVIEIDGRRSAAGQARVSETSSTQQPTSRSPLSDSDRLINKVVGNSGAVGLILLAIYLGGMLLRALLRVGRKTTAVAIEIAKSTSAEDVSRAAGNLTGTVERKARPIVDAFKEGRKEKL